MYHNGVKMVKKVMTLVEKVPLNENLLVSLLICKHLRHCFVKHKAPIDVYIYANLHLKLVILSTLIKNFNFNKKTSTWKDIKIKRHQILVVINTWQRANAKMVGYWKEAYQRARNLRLLWHGYAWTGWARSMPGPGRSMQPTGTEANRKMRLSAVQWNQIQTE